MLKRIITIITVVSSLLLFLLLGMTTPSTAGPLGILGLFVFMYLTALGVLTFLFRGCSVIFSKFPFLKQRRVGGGDALSLRNAYYYASVVALAPVMLIALQSVGEVGPYQILLVLFFVAIGWLYIKNRMT